MIASRLDSSRALMVLSSQALFFETCDARALEAHLHTCEDMEAARAQLSAKGLVAFVADGSVLPRASGASDLPMPAGEAVPFQSPAALRVVLPVPNKGELVGMGIPRGVTLIVGGGFHGKSTLLEVGVRACVCAFGMWRVACACGKCTPQVHAVSTCHVPSACGMLCIGSTAHVPPPLLLQALQLGVYNKVVGDGREGVVTDGLAVKVKAEDGRAVTVRGAPTWREPWL